MSRQDQGAAASPAFYRTVAALAAAGPEAIPAELTTAGHLIYNSPAALDFNSPGAQGFGVKRAGLSVPGSIMLLISPPCCGRNTAALSGPGRYGERFAYYEMDEQDIVTGRHLAKIPEAAAAFIASRKEPPSVLMLCCTCADALLGTDMERVARKVEARVGLPVRPCYMYALTRESVHPPMVQVREAIYSLLSPRPRRATSVNLLGRFTPWAASSDLYALLRACGVKTIRELGRARTYEEFSAMAEANCNLVLAGEAHAAAVQLAKKLAMPFIELQRFYGPARIHHQYQALARVLGVAIDDAALYGRARARLSALRTALGGRRVRLSVGSRLNAAPFELALVLAKCGFAVQEIFSVVQPPDLFFLRALADVSPETRVYSNLSPTMAAFPGDAPAPDLALGADAHFYYPQVSCVLWNDEVQPFGYDALLRLLSAIERALGGLS